MKVRVFIAFVFLVFFSFNCEKSSKGVIAKIGYFKAITDSDLEDQIKKSHAMSNKKLFFKKYIRQEVLYKAAVKSKYHKSDRLKDKLSHSEKMWITGLFRLNVLYKNYGFSDKEIKKYFRKNGTKFNIKGISFGKKKFEKLKSSIIDSMIFDANSQRMCSKFPKTELTRDDIIKDWKKNLEDRYYEMLRGRYKYAITDTSKYVYLKNTKLDKNKRWKLDSSFVLARSTKKFKIREVDFKNYLKKIPAPYRIRYENVNGRLFIINKMLLDEFTYRHAKQSGFIRKPLIKKKLKELRKGLIVREYYKEFIKRDLGFSRMELLKYYKKHRSQFDSLKNNSGTFDNVINIIARRLLYDKGEFENYYLINKEDFVSDSLGYLPLDSVRDKVYDSYIEYKVKEREEYVYNLLKRVVGLKIIKKEYRDNDINVTKENEKKYLTSIQEIITNSGDLLKAEKILLKIRYISGSEVGDEVCLMLGQIYTIQKQYKKAKKEYVRLLRLYPKSNYNYRAQFMIGFIYSEYLKDYKKAKENYEKVIDKYPKCDLVDSAKFMIKNMGKDFENIKFLKN